MGVIGSITLTSVDNVDLEDITGRVNELENSNRTINNNFWQGGSNNEYVYFGNKGLYSNNIDSIAAARIANDEFSICVNNNNDATDGNDKQIARFDKNSLMLSNSYEIRYSINNGLYFKPLYMGDD